MPEVIYGLVALAVAGLVALNLWMRRHPLTEEESKAVDDEARLW